MKIGVSLKINVSMIEKARLFAGQKGKYLDATVFIDINDLDQYGNNGMITQDVSKDEKQQGVKGPILGNCKVFWNDQTPQHQPQSPQQQEQGFKPYVAPQGQQQSGFAQQGQQQAPKVNPQEPTFDDDIPF